MKYSLYFHWYKFGHNNVENPEAEVPFVEDFSQDKIVLPLPLVASYGVSQQESRMLCIGS